MDGLRSGHADIPALVRATSWEAEGVLSVTLEPLDAAGFPPWEPGAHIDLVLPNRLRRQYSLVASEPEADSYRVAVLLEAHGRGGSEYVHLFLRPGQRVQISGPRNHFRLGPAPEYAFIAGGIGITPIIAMLGQAQRSRARWTLDYGGRTRTSMAFCSLVDSLGGNVRLHPQDESGPMPILTILTALSVDAQVYCCGPSGLLTAVQEAAAALGIAADRVHVERFAPAPSDDSRPRQPVSVTAARSGVVVDVPPQTSILDSLIQKGVRIESSCRQGVCGACEVVVLDGVPDHRDDVLTPAERASGTTMMACVSRALTPTLVLDV